MDESLLPRDLLAVFWVILISRGYYTPIGLLK
jgi:hypothetical protein